MRFPINHGFTDEQRMAACGDIFPTDAPNPLQHWAVFMSYEQSHHQSPTEQYTALRAAAFEWFTNHRIQVLIDTIKGICDTQQSLNESTKAFTDSLATFETTIKRIDAALQRGPDPRLFERP